MGDIADLFENGKTTCDRCGRVNDLGSSEALFEADDSTRCAYCGFLFIRHKSRQMAKMAEMLRKDPEWVELLQKSRHEEIKRRLDALVPIDGGVEVEEPEEGIIRAAERAARQDPERYE